METLEVLLIAAGVVVVLLVLLVLMVDPEHPGVLDLKARLGRPAVKDHPANPEEEVAEWEETLTRDTETTPESTTPTTRGKGKGKGGTSKPKPPRP